MSAFGLFADDVTDAQRRFFEAQEAQRRRDLENHVSAGYVPGPVVPDACANGDFEAGLASWSGAYGNMDYGTVSPVPGPVLSTLNAGLLSVNGHLRRSDSRHTVVTAADGPDPIAGIGQVALGSSTAVRIGNTGVGGGVELLDRTFVVRADRPSIGFRYAVILQDPHHKREHQPMFRVRVTNAAGEIHNVVYLDPGEAPIDTLIADRCDTDHFKELLPKDGVIVYRDWTCAYIDLTDHVGEIVTVQFIVQDCSKLGHWGYAYIDDFCDSECVIDFSPIAPEGTTCGAGQLCFNAFPAGVTIQLDLWQNGDFRTSLEHPLHTSGTLYCFPVDPAAPFDPATSFDPAAPFDFIARAKFPSGVVRSIGTAPEGVIPGLNNDYTAEPCCGFGANLVRNGDFESGNEEFDSAFTYEPFPASASVLPREYAVIDETQAAAISPTWIVRSHEACNSAGKFLAVNGDTGNPESRMVWSQTISVVPETGYQFCVYLRNLEQCALDVKPKVSLKFSSSPEVIDPSVIIADCSDACDWTRETRRIVIPAGVISLTAEIWLDVTGEGDGNDLAIDHISLRRDKPEAP